MRVYLVVFLERGEGMTSFENISFALIGKSGAGKSTAAQMIAERYQARRVSTGAICRQISRLLMGDEDKASTQKIDDALIKIDTSIFLKAALRDVAQNESICVDSLRFESDVKIARERGFFVIRITASDQLRLERLKSRGQVFNLTIDGRHRSEVELDETPADLEIVNDGSLDNMRRAVDSICVRV
ncbi:AAA family ATPase [Rhizobium leguminosarum]|uniref:AAA family ATPase n=1 Tax=Rhizobium leguminosarum TaxID=384 RepID=UPI001C960387|nr:AAA family ATPase [Rhizobium leguminosarum]MBY5707508.1 AAA family ATPase [Rhizobium leguminosarum]